MMGVFFFFCFFFVFFVFFGSIHEIFGNIVIHRSVIHVFGYNRDSAKEDQTISGYYFFQCFYITHLPLFLRQPVAMEVPDSGRVLSSMVFRQPESRPKECCFVRV
ncbi:hypothetical protein BKA70DRAFT_1245679, partial [Coprinopsis sp. MPI-PUGE-AT-0042]